MHAPSVIIIRWHVQSTKWQELLNVYMIAYPVAYGHELQSRLVKLLVQNGLKSKFREFTLQAIYFGEHIPRYPYQ